jgi:hypothetical protein
MVFVSLVNISLDITANITWWVVKNTIYSSYYIYTYFIPPPPTKEQIEMLELRNEIISLNKQLHLINSIHNNPNIISRNQIKMIDDDFELISDTEL